MVGCHLIHVGSVVIQYPRINTNVYYSHPSTAIFTKEKGVMPIPSHIDELDLELQLVYTEV